MSLKDSLKVFRWDHLSHYQWASWFAAGASLFAMAASSLGAGHPLPVVALVGAGASIVTAYAAGKLGELADMKANEEAVAAGEEARREVSDSDIMASFAGCVPSALPLLCISALGWVSNAI